MIWQEYHIRGMDCAEEVKLLKQALRPLLGVADAEESLRFDLLNAKLSVRLAAGSGDAVVAAIASTGLSARPWLPNGGPERTASFRERHSRSILSAASALAIVVAFLTHAFGHGFRSALGMDSGEPGAIAGRLDLPLASAALYLVAVGLAYYYVLPRAWAAARRMRPDMNLLMVLAVAGALLLGEFLEAASVGFLFGLSLLLESWSIGRARKAISTLMALAPDTARVVDDCCGGERKLLPVAQVAVGARILVRPGEKIPLDGDVLVGESAVDQSPITGESIPVARAAGDQVYAGSINGDGLLEIVVTRPSSDSTFARILRLVEEAQSRRARSEQWVERFALYYTPVMLGISFLIAVLPPLLFGGPWREWIYQALVILVIACPCALVISTPVSVTAGLARAARRGVLIKGGVFLELPARLKAIAVDKTGTLSLGKPSVEAIVPMAGQSETELLALAASLESQSNHPLARAVRAKARTMGVQFVAAEGMRISQGRGLGGTLGGERYHIGNRAFLAERGIDLSDLSARAAELEASGHSLLILAGSAGLLGMIGVRDELRPEAREALRRLAELGIEHRVVLSGDNSAVVSAIATEAGADESRGELLPADKADAVRELRERYGLCAMVGDGINDAPALATADLGIAMGAIGTDAAIETADIALMTDDLLRLPWLIRHSRRVLAVIKQNIALALGLKLIFMAMALAGIATLWMAIVADMGASLLVIFNGLRLLGDRS